MVKNYYVYQVTDKLTNQFYIGSRGCYCDINEDTYLGSPKTWKPNKKRLTKEIIASFDNRHDAIIFERNLIIDNLSNKLNMNFNIPHPNIHRENLITAKDKSGKIITISKDDPLFGIEYFGVSKGLVLVKDHEDNIFITNITDPRYLNGELIHYNKGKNIGSEHPNFNKVWINNGVKQKLVDSSEILVGWVFGTLQKGVDTPSSHKKSIWVNFGDKNKRIKDSELEEYINKGWKIGRSNLKQYKKNKNRKIVVPNFKYYKWIHNIELKVNKRVLDNQIEEFINNGWVLGRFNFNKK
jgi:hypothetical protein